MSLSWRMIAMSAGLALCTGCGPPQLGGDSDAFDAVNRLYNAVGAQRVDLVERSLSNIRSLHSAGRLQPAARDRLEAIGAKAMRGEWTGALVELKDFARGQHAPKQAFVK